VLQFSEEVSDVDVHIVNRSIVGIHLYAYFFAGEMFKRFPVLGIPFVGAANVRVTVKVRIWRQIGIVHVKVI